MSDPILPLEVWEEGTLQNDVPANDNALRVEAMRRPVLGIEDSPTSSNDGDVFLVGPSPSGDFATFDPDDIAIFRGGNWYAWAPVEGLDINGYLYSGSGGWIVSGGAGVDSVNGQTGTVSLALDDLIDVSAAAPTTTYVLTWNGSAWVASAPSGGMTNPMTTAGDIIIGGSSGTPTRLPAGTDTYVLTMVAGAPAWAAAGGGGLTNWTDSLNSSSPNAPVPVASLEATNAATNVDAALVAKGNGATLAQIPDGTTAGGNKRGTRATDLQKQRNAASQVASGTASTICGGNQNTTQGQEAAICGGYNNTANQQRGFVGAGQSNAAGDHSAVCAGVSNSCASGTNGFIGAGSANAVDAAAGWIPGGEQSTNRGRTRVGAWAGGQFSAKGDAQHAVGVLRRGTTNNTQTELSLDGDTPTFNNRWTLPNNSAYIVRGQIVARQNTTGDCAMWEFVACIKRGANAAATAMVVACTPAVIAADTGAAAWVVDVDADTTNGSLRFRVTGENSKTIRWVVDILASTELAG